MRCFAAVTTFHKLGFETYGGRMLESFDRMWPEDVQLYAYAEDFVPKLVSPRIEIRDLLHDVPDLVAFRDRHQDNPRAHGTPPRRWRIIVDWSKPRIKVRRVRSKDTYRWQAVRFAHKSFAIFDAARRTSADVLFWLDADMLMLSSLPDAMLESMMPREAMLSCIQRPKFSDCCIVGFNLRHPRTVEFLEQFRELYVSDGLFAYEQYHDSFLFDAVAKRFRRQDCLIHDLAGGTGLTNGHVFDHCELGHYMEHLKGCRKEIGASLAEGLSQARPWLARQATGGGASRDSYGNLDPVERTG